MTTAATRAPGTGAARCRLRLRAACWALGLGLAACPPAWAQAATPSAQDIIDQLAPPASAPAAAPRPGSAPGRTLPSPPAPAAAAPSAPATAAAATPPGATAGSATVPVAGEPGGAGTAAAAATAATAAEGQPAAAPPPPSVLRNLRPVQRRIDLVVPFEFNSSAFGAAAEAVLQQLALAMQSERLHQTRFLIEGHTDAKGSADYNDRLSEQRARSVAAYLARQGVATERLTAVGRGFREPLPGEDPLSPVNRRVRIIALE